MRQMTLAHQAEFQRCSRKTWRQKFLAEMDAVMPWAGLLALAAPHYSTGKPVRRRWVSTLCFGFTFYSGGSRGLTPAWETRYTNRRCCAALPGLAWAATPAPDETTILN